MKSTGVWFGGPCVFCFYFFPSPLPPSPRTVFGHDSYGEERHRRVKGKDGGLCSRQVVKPLETKC